jgi:hypothetical protein
MRTRGPGFAILYSLRFEPSHLPVTQHERQRARNSLVIDIPLNDEADTLQAIRGKSDGLGACSRKFLRNGNRGQQQNTGKNTDSSYHGERSLPFKLLKFGTVRQMAQRLYNDS